MRIEKRHMTEEIELPNQEKSEYSEKRKRTNKWEKWKRTLSNKRRWKKKDNKNISGERENYSKPNYKTEISRKGLSMWVFHCVCNFE